MDLEFASLKNADLTNASLRGAALAGANLTGVTMTGADFHERISHRRGSLHRSGSMPPKTSTRRKILTACCANEVRSSVARRPTPFARSVQLTAAGPRRSAPGLDVHLHEFAKIEQLFEPAVLILPPSASSVAGFSFGRRSAGHSQIQNRHSR